MINSMSFISVVNYFLLKKEVEKHNRNKRGIVEVKNLLSKADDQRFLSIEDEISSLGGRALMINNGGWIIYLILPLFILFFIAALSLQFGKIKNIIKEISSFLIYSSDSKRSLPKLA